MPRARNDGARDVPVTAAHRALRDANGTVCLVAKYLYESYISAYMSRIYRYA